ncbi:MAG: hypothetical protein LUH07_13820 [Lachnospiraceae bacterium]|nr:hypothetical protein [Lachnospiraceae bacterium]
MRKYNHDDTDMNNGINWSRIRSMVLGTIAVAAVIFSIAVLVLLTDTGEIMLPSANRNSEEDVLETSSNETVQDDTSAEVRIEEATATAEDAENLGNTSVSTSLEANEETEPEQETASEVQTEAELPENDGAELTTVYLIASAAMHGSGGEEYGAEYEYDGLNLTAYTYWAQDSLGSLTYHLCFTYDEYGDLLSSAYENSNGVNYILNQNSYDADHHCTEIISYDSDGMTESINEYTYDSEGNCQSLRRYTYNNGELESVDAYTYRANGDTLSLLSYDGSGNLTMRHEYSYDENGLLAAEVYGDGEGMILYQEYTYDTKGNVISLTNYDSNGELTGSYVYRYNENGDLLLRKSCDSSGQAQSFYEYTYDEDGMLLDEKRYNVSGVVSYNCTYTYDANGNRLSKTEYGSDGIEERRYVYTYDTYGNVVLYEVYRAGELVYYSELTYISAEATPERAEEIRTQQESSLYIWIG